MVRAVSAIAGLAAVAAAGILAFGSLVQASAPPPVQKSDRADAIDCELRNWPYYQPGCLRDESRNAGRAVRARLVSTDRIDTSRLNINPLAEYSPSPEAIQRANELASRQRELASRRRLKAASLRIARQTTAADSAGFFKWAMPSGDLHIYLAAGDFVRRTVR
jgi:hypothetical protein